MTDFTVRLRRLFFGAGLMLFLLQVVAILSVGLASGYFHHRQSLLLESLTPACGATDLAARMRVAEHLLARVGALDDWQPLCWLPMAALLLALTGTLSACVHWLHRVDATLRRSAWGLLALHGAALLLASVMLWLYEQVWAGITTTLPSACMLELATGARPWVASPQQWLLQMSGPLELLPPHAPDALAIVLIGLLLAAMVVGLWLWCASAQDAYD
ncbi:MULTISPECIES: hypothetical protein [Stenotrophomonas]|uniref:hypothetical protein n=1 Tax=Stenotrophomonas TaxID=40323 RepID=UPI0026E53B29|nr:hypothetical protein [Stenotrophomonas sp. 704A1]